MILILYGSQTGTAQEVAERIYREAKCRHFQPVISAMDDFKVYLSHSHQNQPLNDYKIIIFICSTTGDGEEPDNMKQFWKFLLLKSHDKNLFQDLQCAVFGLGDSSYAK
jgi:sulfite reductase alpha subunit-like flavoprotein